MTRLVSCIQNIFEGESSSYSKVNLYIYIAYLLGYISKYDCIRNFLLEMLKTIGFIFHKIANSGYDMALKIF